MGAGRQSGRTGRGGPGTRGRGGESGSEPADRTPRTDGGRPWLIRDLGARLPWGLQTHGSLLAAVLKPRPLSFASESMLGSRGVFTAPGRQSEREWDYSICEWRLKAKYLNSPSAGNFQLVLPSHQVAKNNNNNTYVELTFFPRSFCKHFLCLFCREEA